MISKYVSILYQEAKTEKSMKIAISEKNREAMMTGVLNIDLEKVFLFMLK